MTGEAGVDQKRAGSTGEFSRCRLTTSASADGPLAKYSSIAQHHRISRVGAADGAPERRSRRRSRQVSGSLSLPKVYGRCEIRLAHALAIVAVMFGNVGRAARADVTDSGTYQTSIAIDVPAFHDITPVIRLDYDSNARNGPLGIGWSLSTGPQIYRTSKFMGVPHYDASDQLWLDGLELVPCSAATLSASCQSGGTHTTRVETYNRIRFDPAANA